MFQHLCPVVISPYLCTSEAPAAIRATPAAVPFASGLVTFALASQLRT